MSEKLIKAIEKYLDTEQKLDEILSSPNHPKRGTFEHRLLDDSLHGYKQQIAITAIEDYKELTKTNT